MIVRMTLCVLIQTMNQNCRSVGDWVIMIIHLLCIFNSDLGEKL